MPPTKAAAEVSVSDAEPAEAEAEAEDSGTEATEAMEDEEIEPEAEDADRRRSTRRRGRASFAASASRNGKERAEPLPGGEHSDAAQRRKPGPKPKPKIPLPVSLPHAPPKRDRESRLEAQKRVLKKEFDLEILLKRCELNAIEEEIRKGETVLASLREGILGWLRQKGVRREMVVMRWNWVGMAWTWTKLLWRLAHDGKVFWIRGRPLPNTHLSVRNKPYSSGCNELVIGGPGGVGNGLAFPTHVFPLNSFSFELLTLLLSLFPLLLSNPPSADT